MDTFTLQFFTEDSTQTTNMPYTIQVSVGSSVQIPKVIPQKKGVVFSHWVEPTSGETYRPGNILTGTNRAMTLRAAWTGLTRTLTFHGNNKTKSVAENLPMPLVVTDREPTRISTIVPVQSGYRFVHWLEEHSGVPYNPGDSIPVVARNMELLAIWEPLTETEFLISFEPNDSAVAPAINMPTAQVVSTGTTPTLPAQTPIREGYWFLSWFDPITQREYSPSSTPKPLSDNLVLYAQWQIHLNSVTFTSNDQIGEPQTENLPEAIPYISGEIVQLPTQQPTKKSCQFANWYAPSLGLFFLPGEYQPRLGTSLELTARWAPDFVDTYTIAYDPNNSKGVFDLPATVETPALIPYTIPLHVPVQEGYSFEGWLLTSTGELYYPGHTFDFIEENISFVAQWAETFQTRYAVFYLPNDTSGPPAGNMPANFYFYEGQNVVLSTLIPTRQDYGIFAGWYWLATGQILRPGDTIINPNQNVFLNAIWTRLPVTQYTIAFFPNDSPNAPASGIPGPIIVRRGGDAQLPLTSPTRPGYIFFSWSDRTSGTSYSPGSIIRNVNTNINLYAVWRRPTTYVISFDGNDEGGT